MARRRYRRSYGRRRYSRRSSRYSSRTVRKALGNLKAANQQKDSATVNINCIAKGSAWGSCKVIAVSGEAGAAGTTYGYLHNGILAVNIFNVLKKSDFFNCYAPMYDQFKIDGIKVKLTPVKWPPELDNPAKFQNCNAFTIVTAWDRSGLSANQFRQIKKDVMSADQVLDYAWYVTFTDEAPLTSYSSAISRSVNRNSSCNIVRYLYPSTAQEKGQYLSTNSLENVATLIDNPDPTTFTSICYVPGSDQNNTKENPCFWLESPSIPFKPTLLVGVLAAEDPTYSFVAATNSNRPSVDGYHNLINEVKFNLEFDIMVTFRGLRKTQYM